MIQDIEARLEKVQWAISKTKVDEAAGQGRIEKLEARLPEVLADEFMEQATAGKSAEIKQEIRELKESVDDMRLVLPVLRAREAALRKEHATLSKQAMKEQAVERYEQLKKEVSVKLADDKTYTRPLEWEFFQAAAGAGKSDEASLLIKELKRVRESRPPVN